jgi:hypothetical protein
MNSKNSQKSFENSLNFRKSKAFENLRFSMPKPFAFGGPKKS